MKIFHYNSAAYCKNNYFNNLSIMRDYLLRNVFSKHKKLIFQQKLKTTRPLVSGRNPENSDCLLTLMEQ